MIFRTIKLAIEAALKRGKSVLLLGARQTGKTTLVESLVGIDATFSLDEPGVRLRYEKDPQQFISDVKGLAAKFSRQVLVFVDEVQKVPLLTDAIQFLIDKKIAQFILSGSSARKLKHGTQVNLLPGRVVLLYMDTLTYSEIETDERMSLEDLLTYGALPGILVTANDNDKETDLTSYVETYLEEEVRAEALVRNIGNFARFLEIAASESGKTINFTRLAQDIGIADTTIREYFQILEDCLIIERIRPISESSHHRRLVRSAKYIFFDLGVRRACAQEGMLSQRALALRFEEYVGNELIHLMHAHNIKGRLRYWRDTAGAEVDFVVEIGKEYFPVEVKWSENPKDKDARHLYKFMQEYEAPHGYIVCRTPQPYSIAGNVAVLPWQQIETILTQRR